ncbi:DUF3332 domain-containing protein [Dysgonomonas sp. 25]|uniref:DUF3332 domain-containing protein n=1 Tax=Dysgonomonas sp. 25 TaxID=2302933 RepID=UPI0013D0156E|nr:DUF3332 domain-containing protein [Dysgonomonas sp. 25]NDV69380.1 DUF3332 domain-containing protein [Dysgonomonas sp. 25]
MKKRFLSVATVLALSGCIMFSSCIGSFNLTNKVLSWNQTIDSKFVNELVFIALWIVPVYEVCFLADILVVNSIEFWTGDNPVQLGEVKQVEGKNGIMYTIETQENGYHIQNEEGTEMNLVYDKETKTWSVATANEEHKLFKFEDENNVIVYLQNGKEQHVELSSQGVMAFKQTVLSSTYLAQR